MPIFDDNSLGNCAKCGNYGYVVKGYCLRCHAKHMERRTLARYR